MRTRTHRALGRRRNPGGFFRNDFDLLANRIQWSGRELAVTDVRTGARKSADAGTSTEVAENVADRFRIARFDRYAAMDGATNLVDTDITAVWAQDSGITRSEPESNVHRIAYAGVGDNRNVYYGIGTASADRITKCQIRLVSGTPSASHSMGFWEASLEGTTFPLDSLTTDWQDAVCSVTSATQTSYMLFNFNSAGGAITIEVRYIRTVASTVAHAAFPDDSAAAASYDGDLYSCTPTFAAAGFAVIPLIPYAWATTGNPADAQPMLFEAGAFTVSLDASGFFTTSGGAVSTKKPAANVASIVIVEWDGVNHSISVDGETPVTAASAVAPSGTAYLGNTALGSKEIHGVTALGVGAFTLTAAQRALLQTGVASAFSGGSLR